MPHTVTQSGSKEVVDLFEPESHDFNMSMSLEQAIHASKKSISASLRALQQIPSSSSSSSSSITLPPLISGLPDAFSELLSQLRHTTTSLALAFKPPITPPAAIQQLNKLHEDFGRVASRVAASSAGQTWDSSALASEWRDGVFTIGSELQRVLDVLDDASRTRQSGSSSNEDNPYLVHTGLVWDAIDRLAGELSTSEVQAVGKRWKSQGEVMKDAWMEFKEFLEDQEGADEESEDGMGGMSDGNEEFGDLEEMLGGGEKMTSEERARANAAKPLLGLHHILHCTLPRYFPLVVLEPDETYRPLLSANDGVVAAFDGAVSRMYPPHDNDDIESSLQDLAVRSQAMLVVFSSRLERASGVNEKRAQCKAFLDKWVARLDTETRAWDERRLSLSSLQKALQ